MLSLSILAKDETSESQYQAVFETFGEGRYLVDIWREIIDRDYPKREYLLDLINNANYLIISKRYFSGIVETDTCNDDQRTRRLLCDLVVYKYKLLFPNASESELKVN